MLLLYYDLCPMKLFEAIKGRGGLRSYFLCFWILDYRLCLMSWAVVQVGRTLKELLLILLLPLTPHQNQSFTAATPSPSKYPIKLTTLYMSNVQQAQQAHQDDSNPPQQSSSWRPSSPHSISLSTISSYCWCK